MKFGDDPLLQMSSVLSQNPAFALHLIHLISHNAFGRVPQWLATCVRKPKVPGSSPAASYVMR